MSSSFKDKVAIITGASKGMGFSSAQLLAQKGARVLLVSRNGEALNSAAQKIINDGGIAEIFAGDVADMTLPDKVVQKALDLWGSTDILVNNAGGPPPGGFLEHNDDAWSSAIETNLLSIVRFSRSVAPHMVKKKWGRIISITSTVSKEPSPAMVLSATARAGVSSFTKAIAIELAPHNITANVICPGGVMTDRLVSLIENRAQKENKDVKELMAQSQQAIPAQRFAKPEEIAGIIAFLASEEGGYINGVSLSVDGALTKAYT